MSPQVPEQPQEAQALFTASGQRLRSIAIRRWEGPATGGAFFFIVQDLMDEGRGLEQPRPFFLPLFSQVRGRTIPRTSC